MQPSRIPAEQVRHCGMGVLDSLHKSERSRTPSFNVCNTYKRGPFLHFQHWATTASSRLLNTEEYSQKCTCLLRLTWFQLILCHWPRLEEQFLQVWTYLKVTSLTIFRNVRKRKQKNIFRYASASQHFSSTSKRIFKGCLHKKTSISKANTYWGVAALKISPMDSHPSVHLRHQHHSNFRTTWYSLRFFIFCSTLHYIGDKTYCRQ